MPWEKNRPPDAKYRTPEHKAERAKYERQMEHDGYLVCAQPECVMTTRTISSGQRWAAGHDDTGTVYIGPVHKRCNDVDAAKRANARQRGKTHAPARRWPL